MAGARRSCRRCFPALFGLLAVVVRRLPGWPMWFAGLWALAGVAEVDGAVRWIPLGCGRFRPDRRPTAAAGPARRRAAGVVRGGPARVQHRRAGVRDRRLVAARRRRQARLGAARGGAARCCICLVLFATAASGPRSDTPAPAPATNRRSPWRRCRATCRGWGWTSTPSAARCSTTTSARRCGWPRTCAPGRAPQPLFVIWPENSSDIDPLANPDAARADRGRGAMRSARRSWSAPSLAGPGYTPRQPGVDQHGDRLESRTPGPATATTSRSCSRSASTCRGGASSGTSRRTPTGRATSCPAAATAWCTPPACRSG